MDKVIEKELSYKLGGIFFEVQNELGRFAREKQYADLLEKKLDGVRINFKREFPIEIAGRKSNFIDFAVENKILIDIKAKPFIKKDDYYQMQRYLRSANKELGIIVNFRDEYLKPKRVLNGKFVDLDKKFVVSDRSIGFTMVELLVSISLFTILTGITSGIFLRSLRTQRILTALISTNNNASLTMEQIAREIRTGKKFCLDQNNEIDWNSCAAEPGANRFQKLIFESATAGKVTYGRSEDNERGYIFRKLGDAGEEAAITAKDVDIKNLSFYIEGNRLKDRRPARITIVLQVSPSKGSNAESLLTNLQTTISARDTTLDYP